MLSHFFNVILTVVGMKFSILFTKKIGIIK